MALWAWELGLDVIARFQGQLLRYHRDNSPPFTWHGPEPVGDRVVSGDPALIFGTFIPLRTHELVVPLASGGLAHYWRDVRSPMVVWNGPTVFGTEVGEFDAVTLIQSDFGDPGNGNMPTNLELVARVGDQLVHYWRDAGPVVCSPKTGPAEMGVSG